MRTKLAILTAATGLVLAAPSTALAASDSWHDEPGDAVSGVPDVQAVSVEIGADDVIRWTIEMPNLSGLRAGVFVDIRVDSDGQMSTGNNGIDHLLRVNGTTNEVGLYAWNGSSFVAAAATSLSASASFPLRVTVARSSLGNPSTLWFWIRAWNYVAGSEPACCFDDAPSTGFYELGLGSGQAGGSGGSGGTGGTTGFPPPPPPPPPGAPPATPAGGSGGSGGSGSSGSTAQSSGAAGQAGQAKPSAGGLASERLTTTRTRTTLVVRLTVMRDATGARVRSGRVRCRASAGGVRLRVLAARFEHGAATCRFATPRLVRDEAIAGSITVEAGGSLTQRFRARPL